MKNTDQNEAMTHLEYNAKRPHLIIPEYGRHLQKLINLAVAIEDKEERNKAAKYIISVMGTLNPHLRDVPDFQHKLWDQIFIMSDFRLEVDSPYPKLSKEFLYQKPEPLPYPQNFPKYRFYGNHINSMVKIANSWEDGEMKEALIMVIANHMKKSYLSWNKETVEDSVIYDHLLELSGGRINLYKKEEELSDTNTLIKINKKQNSKFQLDKPVVTNHFKNKNTPKTAVKTPVHKPKNTSNFTAKPHQNQKNNKPHGNI